MTDPATLPASIPGGRRAQRKASTRRAISMAAQQLVRERGLDAVTVADIADSAEVAHRTFYRYFPSKEDALLLDLRDFLDDYLMLVSSRPPTEHPIDSLLGAVEFVASGLDLDLGAFEWLVDLVDTNPTLAGVQHRLMMAAQDRLTDLFAERLGVPPTDLTPRLCAAAGTAAFHSSVITYARLPADSRGIDDLWALGQAALEAYATGLRNQPESG
jgi:AcrR family transcriptional regulator